MQALPASPRRSAADRVQLTPNDDAVAWPPQHLSLRKLRAVRRILLVLLFAPPACLLQAVLLLCAPVGKIKFAVYFWKTISQLIGLEVRVIGVPARTEGEHRRPVIYACNHSSWLDIPAVGGVLRACFVSKDDVAGWPIIGTIARLGRSIFVSRSRQGIGRERDEMQARLRGGDDLILFPEGTSSDGSRVLPFHSSFFAAAYGEATPLIQPVSVVYDRLENLPVGRSSRIVFAWFGDMSLAPHVWQVVQWKGKRVTLLFHPPLDPADFASRKALSQATWEAVADGASALRQNRAAPPSAIAGAIAAVPPAFAKC
jgi:1-acyl-sn-glycerol-3-phosphate acyltransferase